MSEPLDVEAMAASGGGYPHRAVAGTGCPVCSLLAEVERLRGELARQAEQITAVRVLHSGHSERSYGIFPCATIEALDGTS